MGRNARGVVGIRLEKGDAVVGMVVCHMEACLLTVTEYGYGKRTQIPLYRKIHRGGKGVIDIQTTERNGKIVGILEAYEDDEFMIITKNGVAIRSSVSGIRAISRNTQGVRLIRLEEGDEVAAIGKLPEAKEEKKAQVNGIGNGNSSEITDSTDEELFTEEVQSEEPTASDE
jgi:DNA gyrase subunit A